MPLAPTLEAVEEDVQPELELGLVVAPADGGVGVVAGPPDWPIPLLATREPRPGSWADEVRDRFATERDRLYPT